MKPETEPWYLSNEYSDAFNTAEYALYGRRWLLKDAEYLIDLIKKGIDEI